MAHGVIKTDRAPGPGGSYSQGRKAGGFIFVAQQDPIDPKTRKVPGPTLADQVPRVVENIKAILEAGGGTLDDIVQMNVYLASTDLFTEFSRIFGTLFRPPYPARCTIQVGRPWGPDRLLEMDAIAYVGDTDSPPDRKAEDQGAT